MDAAAEKEKGKISMWDYSNGKKIFTGGRDSWNETEKIAAECGAFSMDCEDECITDDVSCYNCRYRRWTSLSFECVKGDITNEN